MCCDSWGRNESDTTEGLIWSDLKLLMRNIVATLKAKYSFAPLKASQCKLHYEIIYSINSFLI